MASRRVQAPPALVVPVLTTEQIDRGIAKLMRRRGEVAALTARSDGASRSIIAQGVVTTILEVFGQNSPQYRNNEHHRIWDGAVYVGMSDGEHAQGVAAGIVRTVQLIDALVADLNDMRTDALPAASPSPVARTGVETVRLLCERAQLVVRQLRERRHEGGEARATLDVGDEYDLQDLFHALLHIWFDDIRPEEVGPSQAGAQPRMDFLLKNERIVVELKHTRPSMTRKSVGDELLADIGRYQSHPDCKTLVCFIYDPSGRVGNPRGFEQDLTKKHNELDVIVLVRPL